MLQSIKKRIEKLENSIQKTNVFLITLKDGSQVRGNFDTAFQYAVQDPSDAVRIEDITQGSKNGKIPALLNALLEEDDKV